MNEERMKEVFAEVEQFGVRHDDQALRNVTYRASDGRFCLIDFEFATILEHPELAPPKPEPEMSTRQHDEHDKFRLEAEHPCRVMSLPC